VIALGGFVSLITMVARYMRRTTATIAAGENQLRHLALHDALSGLPNRVYLNERLESLFDNGRPGAPPGAAPSLDHGHFKAVYSALGHPIGDALLRSVAERLTRTLRGDDLVARLGGDEFALLTTGAADRDAAQTIAMRIINAVCSPYMINGHTIIIGVSIGIALIDGQPASAPALTPYAHIPLY